MNNQRCIKELSGDELFAKYDKGEVELREQFGFGGRILYYFYCPACRYEHCWISEKWGVFPSQPALGWQ
jgi:hypothetical protein